MMDTPGVQYVSTVAGYSLLSGVNTTYSAFFFRFLQALGERTTPEESYDGDQSPPADKHSQGIPRELHSRSRRPLSPA